MLNLIPPFNLHFKSTIMTPIKSLSQVIGKFDYVFQGEPVYQFHPTSSLERVMQIAARRNAIRQLYEPFDQKPIDRRKANAIITILKEEMRMISVTI